MMLALAQGSTVGQYEEQMSHHNRDVTGENKTKVDWGRQCGDDLCDQATECRHVTQPSRQKLRPQWDRSQNWSERTAEGARHGATDYLVTGQHADDMQGLAADGLEPRQQVDDL